MAYKYAKGKVYRGDIYDEDDTQRDTYIDFGGGVSGKGNYIGLVASGSAVLVVTGSSVGIGTASPTHEFEVHPDDDATAIIGRAYIGHSFNSDAATFGHYDRQGAAYAIYQSANATTILNSGYSAGAQPMYFRINNSTKMTLDNSGKLGIGTSAPARKLHVSGSNTEAGIVIKSDSAAIELYPASGPALKFGIPADTDSYQTIGTFSGRHQILLNSNLDFQISGALGGVGYYLDQSEGNVGIGTQAPDHELTIVGNVSASSNVSASAFYGDGSNLDGVGSNIHAPWISGSDLTYETTYSGSAKITLSGYNFASGIVASLESQFTTDGHSTGSTTWNNPTSVSFPLTASAQTASYDIILTNTDGLTYTLSDGMFITSCAAGSATLQTIELTSNDDIAESDVLGFADDGGVAGNVEGLRITGSPPDLWGTQCHSVAEIACADRAYIECTPTVMSTSPSDAYHWMMGFGYSGSYAAGPTYDFEWMRWDVYCWGGGAIAAQSPGGTTLVDGSGHPSAWNDTTLAQMAVGRSLRLEIIDSTVYVKYSDDSWSTETTFWTFPEKVDIAGNSNLVAGFAIHKGSGNDGVIENIKMYGRLEGIDNGDNGH
tara:strand:- start:921 stop:2726 length:1806 start_codon:yes stop_codon:yes gene_type:complete